MVHPPAYADAVATYLGLGVSRLADIAQRPLSVGEYEDQVRTSLYTTGDPHALGLRRGAAVR